MRALRQQPHRCAAEADLRDWGYCVVRGVVPEQTVEEIAEGLLPRFACTPFSDGFFNGYRTKRFQALLSRAPVTASLVLNPEILALAQEVLGPFCDSLQLNLTQASEIHGGELPQVPHRDQDMWAGEKGRIEYLVNVMWPLTPFTRENGGTRLWPGSHRRQEERRLPEEQAVCPELIPGDALVFLGSTLHGAGANRTALPRRGIIVSYCLGWLKPYENMWLTYPPEIARTFCEPLQALVGYQRHRPNLGNYDGQCPSILLGEGQVPEYLGASDALAPDQQRRLEAFARGQATGL